MRLMLNLPGNYDLCCQTAIYHRQRNTVLKVGLVVMKLTDVVVLKVGLVVIKLMLWC